MTTTAQSVAVSGSVQGVGFRWWTHSQAASLPVVGWVRNASDGTVRAHVQGPPEAVDELVDRMGRGPRWSRVDNVSSTPTDVDPSLQRFEITH